LHPYQLPKLPKKPQKQCKLILIPLGYKISALTPHHSTEY
jgi:hypothetical protein